MKYIITIILLCSLNAYQVHAEEEKPRFIGQGISVTILKGLPFISDVMEKTPAAETNLKAGDIILEVDNNPVTKLSVLEILSLIEGKQSGTANIKVLRNNKEITATLNRKENLLSDLKPSQPKRTSQTPPKYERVDPSEFKPFLLKNIHNKAVDVTTES